MNFQLTLEQTMLRDSVRRFVDSEYAFEHRRKRLLESDGTAFDKLWSAFAELGWLAAGIPEQWEGLGGGPVSLAIILEELGRALVVEPYLTNAVLAAAVLGASGTEAHQRALLPALGRGELRMALAAYEFAGRYALDTAQTEAKRDAQGYLIDGHKILATGAGSAHKLIVSARLDGGIALFVVDADTAGVTRKSYRTVDHHEASDIRFQSAIVPPEALLVGPERGLTVLEEAVDHAIVGLCAEMIGGMERAIEMTVAYMKQRTQFGRALADFQVQQHRSADMFIETDSARSMVFAALAALDGPADERRRIVSACKVKVMEAAKMVTGNAIHQHGGMGMTVEYPVGHYFRRVLVAERLFGDADHHVRRFAALAPTGAGR